MIFLLPLYTLFNLQLVSLGLYMINLFYFATEIIVPNDFITFDTSRLIIVRSMWSVHVGYSRVIVHFKASRYIPSYAQIRNCIHLLKLELNLIVAKLQNLDHASLKSFKFFKFYHHLTRIAREYFKLQLSKLCFYEYWPKISF